MLNRETHFTSVLTRNDTFAIEDTHNYEILADFSGASPLPVSLLNFRAVAEDNSSALLTWQTATEQNSRSFIIQRQTGAAAALWDSIGSVPAAGNSASLLSYSFTDQHPVTGANYYRLILTNADNSRQYSEVREVNIGPAVHITVYPNPAHDNVVIQRSIDDGESSILLYDATGRLV